MTTNHALLISIRPEFVESIFAGTKTIELRRVKPRLQAGDLVVIYASGCTKGIVGAFEVEGVTSASPASIWKSLNAVSGLQRVDFDSYFKGRDVGHAIHVGKLWKLAVPIPLRTLRKRRIGFRPPQSYHYWKLDDLLRMGGNLFLAEIGRTKPETRISQN